MLRGSRQEVLSKAAGNVRQKISRAVKVPGAGRVREIDEGGFDPLYVGAELHRMRAANVGKDFLELKASLAAICGGAG